MSDDPTALDPDALAATVRAARDALNDRAGRPYLDQFLAWTDAVTGAAEGALANVPAARAAADAAAAAAAAAQASRLSRAWTAADAPEVVVAAMPADGRVAALSVAIETPLSPGVALHLGTRADPDLFFAPRDFAFGAAAMRYLDWPDRPLAAGTEVILRIDGAPTSGGGRVRLTLDTEI